MPKPLTRRERTVAAKYKKFLKAKERAETQYKLADKVCREIAQSVGIGKSARISSEGRALEVVDLAKKAIEKAEQGESVPVLWGHGGARFYELKEIALAAE